MKQHASSRFSKPTIPKRYRALWVIVIYACLLGVYTLANQLIDITNCRDLTLAADHLVPFVAGFVFPFYILYVVLAIPAVILPDKSALQTAGLKYLSLFCISFAIFLLFPVMVPRPDVIGSGIPEKLVNLIYRHDRPVCGFPSLHVSASLLTALVVIRYQAGIGKVLFFLCALTSISTLFIKQHVLLDVLGGVIIALIVDWMIKPRMIERCRLGVKTLRLLSFNAACLKGRMKDSNLVIRTRELENGLEYDLYLPATSPKGMVLAIPGVTLEGGRDPRLVCFAKALALSGLRVAAVSLPSLCTCRFDEQDAEAIAQLAITLNREFNQKIRVVGFSFGAGLALIAAGNEKAAPVFDRLLLFGAHYDLLELQTLAASNRGAEPKTEAEWDTFIWLRLVEAFRALPQLDLPADIQTALTTILRGYCHEVPFPEKIAFYENHLKGLDTSPPNANRLEPDVLLKASPKHQLGRVQARVILIHDVHDLLVPYRHSENIKNELDAAGARDCRVLITPLLSHVTPKSIFKASDALRLMSYLGEMLSE